MTLAELAVEMNKVGAAVGGSALVLVSKGDPGAQLDELSKVKVTEMIEMLETVREPAKKATATEPAHTSLNVVKGELYFPGEWAEKFCKGKYRVVKVVVLE